MRRVLILIAVLTVAVVGWAVPATADPPGPLTGRWQLQDFGETDNSSGSLVITPSGRYRLFDDAASICLDRIGQFVPVTIAGVGAFSDGGLTLTTSANDIVYCYTGGGRVDTGPIGAALVFAIDTNTGRIADNPPVDDLPGTCYWRTGTPQPASCPP